MFNFEEQIEKYRRELMEFSKAIPEMPCEECDSSEETEDAIPVMAQPKAEEETEVEFIPEQTESEAMTEEESAPLPERQKINLVPNVTYNSYDDFMAKNSSSGKMKVQVTAAETIPISNARVEVSVELPEGERELFSGLTDIDGIVDNITLPAPSAALSFDENSNIVPFAVYTVKVTNADYATAEYHNAPVFEGIKSIQPVTLVPLTQNGEEPGRTVYTDQTMNLFGGEN